MTAPALTFENNDAFNRKPFAERLTKAITSFYPLTDGGYVLSLNAKFGSGKTTFLTMWENYLKEQGHTVISLNAWETDFDEDPIIAIVSALLEHLGEEKKAEKLKMALKGFVAATLLATNQVLEKCTGIDGTKVLKDTEEYLKQGNLRYLSGVGAELFASHHFKKQAYTSLKVSLEEYVKALGGKPLIILVDELDRVRPDYSVKFLEAIKHLFSVQGVCFVLAVDREQLECSVKQLYGNLDFNNYYLRFITREANLPEPESLDLKRFIEGILRRDLEKMPEHVRGFCFSNDSKVDSLHSWIVTISKSFKLSVRAIEHLLRVFLHYVNVEKTSETAVQSWLIASLFLIALKQKDREFYNKICTGYVQPQELDNYIQNSGMALKDGKIDNAVRFLILDFHAQLSDNMNNIDAIKGILGHNYAMSVGRVVSPEGNSGFQQIYKHLEEWRSYIE